MEPGIPEEVRQLLDNYVKLLCSGFGNAVYGVYLYGSLVTGCFDKSNSDIDFMTVMKRSMDREDIQQIRNIHKKLRGINRYGGMLEGEYVNCEDIVGGMPARQYPYFAFGKFQGFVGLKKFAWFQLKERGVAYYGADFKTIAGTTDWDEVRSELLERIDSYWPNIANGRLLLDRWLALVVLSVCRIYFTLENMSTTSKAGGGEYALSRLPERWRPLITEALRIQKGASGKSLYKSRFKRIKEAKEFIRLMSDKYSMKFYIH